MNKEQHEKRWQELRSWLQADANVSGEMMSMAEWMWVTQGARNILKYMDELEKRFS